MRALGAAYSLSFDSALQLDDDRLPDVLLVCFLRKIWRIPSKAAAAARRDSRPSPAMLKASNQVCLRLELARVEFAKRTTWLAR